jgi:hypothetical protein
MQRITDIIDGLIIMTGVSLTLAYFVYVFMVILGV